MILLILTSQLNCKEVVHLTNGEWPPYLSEYALFYGFASQVVTEAFDVMGIDVEYQFFPWPRAYSYALEGTDGKSDVWNGTVVWVFTEERANDFYYSDPVVIDSQVLFYMKKNPLEWHVIEDLAGKRIGGTIHTVYHTLENAEKSGIITFERSGTYELLFDRLLSGRIDAIPQVSYVGRYFMKNYLSGDDRFKISIDSKAIETREYHLILTKKIEENQHYIRAFNKGLQILRQEGRYDELLQMLEEGYYDNTVLF